MPKQIGPTKATGIFAMTAATGAVACAACCVLPFALPAAALAATWNRARIARGRTDLGDRIGGCRRRGRLDLGRVAELAITGRPAPSTLYVMGSATALTAVAIMWPRIEPALVRALLG